MQFLNGSYETISTAGIAGQGTCSRAASRGTWCEDQGYFLEMSRYLHI